MEGPPHPTTSPATSSSSAGRLPTSRRRWPAERAAVWDTRVAYTCVPSTQQTGPNDTAALLTYLRPPSFPSHNLHSVRRSHPRRRHVLVESCSPQHWRLRVLHWDTGPRQGLHDPTLQSWRPWRQCRWHSCLLLHIIHHSSHFREDYCVPS